MVVGTKAEVHAKRTLLLLGAASGDQLEAGVRTGERKHPGPNASVFVGIYNPHGVV